MQPESRTPETTAKQPETKSSETKKPESKTRNFDDQALFEALSMVVVVFAVAVVVFMIFCLAMAAAELAQDPFIQVLKTFGQWSGVSVLALTAFAMFVTHGVMKLVALWLQ